MKFTIILLFICCIDAIKITKWGKSNWYAFKVRRVVEKFANVNASLEDIFVFPTVFKFIQKKKQNIINLFILFLIFKLGVR